MAKKTEVWVLVIAYEKLKAYLIILWLNDYNNGNVISLNEEFS